MSQLALQERASREIQTALRLLKEVEDQLRIIGFYFRQKGLRPGSTLPVGLLIDDLKARLEALRVVRKRFEREVPKHD